MNMQCPNCKKDLVFGHECEDCKSILALQVVAPIEEVVEEVKPKAAAKKAVKKSVSKKVADSVKKVIKRK